MGSVPISTRTINHFIIIKLNPVKSLMGTDPISPQSCLIIIAIPKQDNKRDVIKKTKSECIC